ncbi:hypothetical protein [Thermogemmatispora sp.]|uniref:hypothetical protein n=1 Tax=Thermogemmatispora sp. TaxID=1968838 RepID=UPI001DDA04B0|nr:hypothetical protein [Thermogemmatispora sp.]MBX5448587.1 hypothetical protein [Thermogemmatispora sp.]
MDEAVAKERTSTGGAYIWFHYKTQFAAHGRLHIVQVEVPVPVDAGAEERERLLEEALSGLDQFSTRLEQRLKQMVAPSTMPEASPPGDESGRPPSSHLASSRESLEATRSAQRPPSAPAASATSQRLPSASQLRRRMAPALPSTPGVFGNLNSDLTLPQFLQILRDNFNMDSKQAMKLLGVRSLSNLNLREALDQLRYLVAQRSQATSPSMPGKAASLESAYPGYPAVFSQREWHQGHARGKLMIEAEEQEQEEAYQEPLEKERAGQTSAHEAFYAESDIDEEYQKASYPEESSFQQDIVYENEECDGGLNKDSEENEMGEEGEEWSAESQEGRQLSVRERVHARTLLNKLREVRGNTPVSQTHLAVLWNVIGDQISEDELCELIGRIWGVTALKQLSIDQVEALITWAKQDDFERDVAMILALN